MTKIELKRTVKCIRCGRKYDTYMARTTCNNICNDEKCYQRYLAGKREKEVMKIWYKKKKV